ncbi:geraniol 8-hydroxylase-like isoform X1 [Durio zibethinus]|uniref:Geraniol 8-hydroxylase-like isoform X1 n=1 Tax=Durio zibethinus TaxID=66656 RepID=A0A6P5YAD1_DURZI|nr:geraniol 8-hydroxylase-like isoform X1 [Durio zibethinus]
MNFLISSLLCLLLTWVLVQAFHSTRRGSKASSSNLPPGPRRLPIFGNLFDLGDKPHKSLAKLAETHGPVMSLKLGSLITVVVSTEKTAKEVLQKHDLTFSNRTIIDAVRACRHNEVGLPWIPVSPLWRNLRKVCTMHLFSSQKLYANQYLRRKKIQELTANIKKSCHTDLVDPNSPLAREFRKTMWGIVKLAGKPNLADYFPILRKIDPLGVRSKMTIHFDKMLDLFGKMFDERLQSRKAQGSTASSDMLDALVDNIIEGDSEELNKTHVTHLLLVLFVAGTDTTSSTLEWAMAELLRNPQVLSKAKQELKQAVGKGNPVQESDIIRLPYLQAIIKETFRMHPAAPLLVPRRAGANAEICGFTVPEGAQVFVNAWAIGRDPSIWENPSAFMPERFLGSDIDVKGRDFVLIPFGAGRRICPGLPLANRMLHLMLGSLIHSFDWKLEGGILPKDMNMEENLGLRAIPILV